MSYSGPAVSLGVLVRERKPSPPAQTLLPPPRKGPKPVARVTDGAGGGTARQTQMEPPRTCFPSKDRQVTLRSAGQTLLPSPGSPLLSKSSAKAGPGLHAQAVPRASSTRLVSDLGTQHRPGAGAAQGCSLPVAPVFLLF